MRKLLVMAMLLAAVGCYSLMSESGSWGGGGGGSSYSTDRGTVQRGLATLTHDDHTYLVVITSGGAPTHVSGGPPGSGTIQGADGRALEWTCNTRDGVTGKLVIGSEKLRLEDGGVILVDMKDGRTVVEQASVDMRLFEGGSLEDRLKVIAATDTRVAGFLKAAESPRKP